MSHHRASSPEEMPKNASDTVWTVVVAGGSGLRFGARKQFADLGGRSVLQRSVDAASSVSVGIVVVVPADAVDGLGIDAPGHIAVVAGGASRAESVRAGLAEIPVDASVVLVHDAARPLASARLFARVVAAVLAGAAGVVPVIPVADTIRSIDGGVIDRDRLLAVQTPQGFNATILNEAHALSAEATDDATLVEALGHTIETVEGEPANRKLTEPTDLVSAAALLDHAIADGKGTS